MTYLGYALIAAGFLGATFIASLDPTTVNWLLFGAAMALGVIGVFVFKRASRAAAEADTVLQGNRATLSSSLEGIIRVLDDLETRKDTLDVDAFRMEIDDRLRGDLIRFVEARESMKPLFGLQVYADVMSAFATGERYLNRIWAASADGYVEEARAYVDRARAQFVVAHDRLKTA